MHDYVLLYFFLTLKYKEFVTHLKMTKLYDSIFRPYFNSAFRDAVRLRFITVLAEIRFLIAKLCATQAQRHFLAPPRLSISPVFFFLFLLFSGIKLA